MTDLPAFRIRLAPGDCRVLMDDLDLSSKVRSVTIAQPGPLEVPSVILEIPSTDVEVTGQAAIFMDGHFWQQLESINPAELEDEALKRTSYGESFTSVVLELVKEHLRGSQA